MGGASTTTTTAIQKDESKNSNSLISSSIIYLYIAIRIGLANIAPISDCDEVYNYWEPVHFVHHGSGMQTWEYAPQYALRTYAYIFPMSCLSYIYTFLLQHFPKALISCLTWALNPAAASMGLGMEMEGRGEGVNKVLVFRLMRCTLALFTALGELRLCHALQRITNTTSVSIPTPKPVVSLYTMFLLLTSAGMFHASPAYLPSATVMVFWTNSAACQLNAFSQTSSTRNELDGAIVWGLMAVLTTGWPFCGVLFLPLGIVAVYRSGTGGSNGVSIKPVLCLLARVSSYALLIQSLVSVIDYRYYGRIVFPTLNVFIYNTGLFGADDGINRDDLYGIEPVSYYLKNLLLNWNLAAVLGILALPCLLLLNILPKTAKCKNIGIELILLPSYIWMISVFTRPHKEERFLFPIYPALAVGTAVLLDRILYLIFPAHNRHHREGTKVWNENHRLWIGLGLLFPIAAISVLRSMALVDGYGAPLDVYSNLYHHHEHRIHAESLRMDHESDRPVWVCTGGEWYRFPSSFHLPKGVELRFLPSSFAGQLPRPFTVMGSRKASEGTDVDNGFNDRNVRSMDSFVDISDCTYVVELVDSEGEKARTGIVLESDQNDEPECLTYMRNEGSTGWRNVVGYKFMDAEQTSTLNRVLYLPSIGDVRYKSFNFYEREPTTIK